MAYQIMEFREALNETIRVFQLKAVDIAVASGVNEQEISRYRKGHKDINSTTLHKIITGLPKNARTYFLVLATEEKEPVKTA
jgi:hypothetical protein